jgi:hypothetical protein
MMRAESNVAGGADTRKPAGRRLLCRGERAKRNYVPGVMLPGVEESIIMRSRLAVVLSLAMCSVAMADAITSKDVTFYTADATKWDGKKVTVMVTGCSTSTSLTKDKKKTIFYVYSMNGDIYVHVPAERAKAFMKRYGNQNYTYQRRILVGTFRADGPLIEVEEDAK